MVVPTAATKMVSPVPSVGSVGMKVCRNTLDHGMEMLKAVRKYTNSESAAHFTART